MGYEFSVIIYSLLVILLIVLIVLGVKMVFTLTKVDKILDEVDEKIEKFDIFFNILDSSSAVLEAITNPIVNGIAGLINKFRKNKKEEEDYE